MKTDENPYYLPPPSYWPIIGSIAIFLLLLGAANWLHQHEIGPILFCVGALLLAYMMFGWFGTVIKENRQGLLQGAQMNRSFRLGMGWFIFTEVMFFGAFFGALFYSRYVSVEWLGGSGHGKMTHLLLWPSFHGKWPVYTTPNPNMYQGPRAIMETWGIPAINTLLLLSSAGTLTVAHWALLKSKRTLMLFAQIVTIVLGLVFISMQAYEYGIAYTEKGLKLSSGIFGTTFFMLTGFHAMHVTIGAIILIVILYRMFRYDFNPKNHFAFEASAWYWHFVDVVWLALFIFVYWM
jgi:cytochrome c oxidase subunit III